MQRAFRLSCCGAGSAVLRYVAGTPLPIIISLRMMGCYLLDSYFCGYIYLTFLSLSSSGFSAYCFGSDVPSCPMNVLSPLPVHDIESIAEWTATRSCEVPPGDGAAREGKAGGIRDGAHPPEGCHRMLPKGGSQPLRQVSGRMREVLQCRD